MMYPARGGLDWDQIKRGVLSEVRGSISARGGVCSIGPTLTKYTRNTVP